MARSLAGLQKTIKALVSKEYAAREHMHHQLPWHESHLAWGLIGAALALLLFAAGVLVPVALVARLSLVLCWIFATLAAFVFLRDQHLWLKIGITALVATSTAPVLWVIGRQVDPVSEILSTVKALPDVIVSRLKPYFEGRESQPGKPVAAEVGAPQPSIELSLALVPTIHRQRDPGGHGYMKDGQNDLIGILRVHQRNGMTRHVRSLQVVGDVSADCGAYITSFYPALHGQYSEDDLYKECSTRRPFFHISWISYPTTPAKVDGNDEMFARFKITRSLGALEFTGDPRSFFGFEDSHTRPKYPLTTPVWSLLVRFSGTNPADLTGIAPTPREEVKSGRVKVEAALDDELIDIPPKAISNPWAVPLSEEYAARALDQELFNGIQDGGLRSAHPSENDPLVEPSRAWVTISSIDLAKSIAPDDHIASRSFLYNVFLGNVGAIQAGDVKARTVSPAPLPCDFGDSASNVASIQDGLLNDKMHDNASGQVVQVPTDRVPRTIPPMAKLPLPFTISALEPQNYREGTYCSFTLGRVDYKGTALHWMKFCVVTVNSNGDLRYCKEGNDHDN